MSAFPRTEFLRLSLKFQWHVPSGGKSLVPTPSSPRYQTEQTVSFLDASLWLNPSASLSRAGFYEEHRRDLAKVQERQRTWKYKDSQQQVQQTVPSGQSAGLSTRSKWRSSCLSIDEIISARCTQLGATSFPWTLLISGSRAHEFAPIN